MRLRSHEANRITTEGELVIQGQRFRDQGKNIEDCLTRLREMILGGATREVLAHSTIPVLMAH